MILCSCATYAYKRILQNDPLYSGWGCPWIPSHLKYPDSEGCENECDFCGDYLMPNGRIYCIDKSKKLKEQVNNEWWKNSEKYYRYKNEIKLQGLG